METALTCPRFGAREKVRVALVALALAGCSWMTARPDLSAYEVLRQPRIVERPSERVLQVTARGVPGETAGKAIGALMRSYYGLDVDKSRFAPPKARWQGIDKPQSEWTGIFAMTIPETITSAPASTDPSMPITIATWEYGPTAEILHEGGYDMEGPTLERLRAYIAAQGYEVIGDHEEEYVVGPGSPGAGQASSWLTVLRLRVQKR